jgi:TolB-like protein
VADIFISYARKDEKWVARLAASLEKAGYSVWWDRNLVSGTRYLKETEAQLRMAKATIVVWSKTSVESHWVADEATLARDLGRLAPISIDGTMPPLGFGQYQATKFSGWREGRDAPLQTLLVALAEKTGQSAAPATPAAQPTPAHQVRAAATAPREGRVLIERTRPSIAVLPFTLASTSVHHRAIAEALPHDLIVELSRLRWLFVTARGSSFQFRGADALEKVAAALGVAYCLTGAIDLDGDVMNVTVELSNARAGAIVWSERFRAPVDKVHEVRASIVQSVLGALELQIPLNEARLALKSPENLDAWASYHLGLHHMYRFSREGNDLAATHFQRAADSEPGFARAYAGLSFAHFENAFLRTVDDTSAAAALARRYAEKGLEFDQLDPFCNLVMGRTYWLSGDLEGALPWLDRAIELNPNYAQAKYSRAWTETMLGFGADGQANAEAAIALSPLDPLLYGMLGVKAFAQIVLDQPAEAARWAERAARSPRAHPLIELIAAAAHEMNGDGVKARAWTASALARHPGLSARDFLAAFPFRDPHAHSRVAAALGRLGL